MISKEKIEKGYIKNDEGKLRELFVKAAQHYGFEVAVGEGIEWLDFPFIYIHPIDTDISTGGGDFGKDELTLIDFEEEAPLGQEEGQASQYRYERLEVESIFHLQQALQSNTLVFGNQKKPVLNEWALMKLLVEGKHEIYLKEELKWQEEVLEYLKKPSKEGFEEELPSKFRVDYMNSSFHLVDSEFLEMCRTALRATGELK